MNGFILLACGFVGGIVASYIVFWNMIRSLEDDLANKEDLLIEAVNMLREERKNQKKWQKVTKCDSVDFSKKW